MYTYNNTIHIKVLVYTYITGILPLYIIIHIHITEKSLALNFFVGGKFCDASLAVARFVEYFCGQM